MDRDNNWDRIKHVYDTIVTPVKSKITCPLEHIRNNYKNKIFDEVFE
jgi:bisphosphoglycerate-independent phosphoglycerate mutase (AlkP superfamily)